MLGLAAWMNGIWNELKMLRARNHQMTQEVAALQILIAGNYVKREEMRGDLREITSQIMDRFDRVDRKVDSGFSDLYDELKTKADK